MAQKLNWKKFIRFWSKFYNNDKYQDKKFYYPYIRDLSKNDFLDELWLWKMQVHFYNRTNKKALKSMRENIETIRSFRGSNPTFNDLYKFSRKIFKSGVVYPAFLIHICKPNDYPIFDQHVFRAFTLLTTKKIVDAPKDIQDYLSYRRFVFSILKKYKIGLRDIDKALMAFGQFLNNPQKFLKSPKANSRLRKFDTIIL